MEILTASLAILAVVFVIWAIAFAIDCVISIFLYRKLGMPGWYGIIPYFKSYVLYKELWEVKFFLVAIIASFVTAGACAIPNDTVRVVICLLTGAVSFAMNIILSNKLSKAFGRSELFTVGLVLFPIIFKAILAFGGSQRIVDSYDGGAGTVQQPREIF